MGLFATRDLGIKRNQLIIPYWGHYLTQEQTLKKRTNREVETGITDDPNKFAIYGMGLASYANSICEGWDESRVNVAFYNLQSGF